MQNSTEWDSAILCNSISNSNSDNNGDEDNEGGLRWAKVCIIAKLIDPQLCEANIISCIYSPSLLCFSW